MRRSVAILGLLVACSFATAVEGRQGGSAIRGRVTDEQQGVLPGVAIVVTHAGERDDPRDASGADGTYPGSRSGARALPDHGGARRASAGSRRKNIVLRIGATLQVDLALRVGAMEESVTVTAEAPQVDLTTAQVGGSVGSGDLTNLPSGSRNFTGAGGAAARRGLQRGGRLVVRQRDHQRPARRAAWCT